MYYRKAKGGFTLTELLVSTAIFAILMTSIAALFVAAIHSLKAGYQSQGAFEQSRGVFNVLERDLTTVYTSRDFGQYYQFYGNEYGMMMVGLLQLRDASGREYTRIGRITYVIYPVVLRGPDGSFYVTEPFGLDYAKNVGASDTGLAPYFLKTHGVRYSDPAVLSQNSDAGNLEIGVAALIRYVEPGVSDLDSYPFDWEELIDYYESNPEFPSSSGPDSIRGQLNAALDLPANVSDSELWRQLTRLDDARGQRFAAKKRDLWLRMLSGQKYWIPRLVGGTPFLPNPWGRIDPNNGTIVEPCWLRGGGTATIVNPRDYIVVDNMGVYTNDKSLDDILGRPGHQDYWTTWPLMAYVPKSNLGYKPFLEYGRVTADTTIDLMPFWNSNRQSYVGFSQLPKSNDGIDNDNDGTVDEVGEGDLIDNDQDGEVDEPGERIVVAGVTDPSILDLDPNAYMRDGRDNDADGLIDTDDPDGDAFQNPIEMDGIDNDHDGTIDEPGETVDSSVAPVDLPPDAPNAFVAYGSPLQPRLPEVVMARIPMVYDPAYLKAPTFERSMEQLIEVPTAYTRSQLAYDNP